MPDLSDPSPVISVIAPLHNEERYLDEMIRSLSDQSFDRWEAVLVDDGSSDSTVDIMMRWAQRDSRIRVVAHGRKIGKVPAFNLAFRNSVGEYVCHVGGDDRLPPDSLQMRVSALASAPSGSVALGKLQVIDHAGRKVGPPLPRGRNGSQSSPGATYARALCDRLFPIPEELPSEDIWLGNASVGAAGSVIHIDRPVIEYRMHAGNSNPRHKSFHVMNESMHERARAVRLLLDRPDLGLDSEFRSTLEARWSAEELRYHGRTLALLAARAPGLVDRLALASMSGPRLWRLRQRLGVRGSGWRGR